MKTTILMIILISCFSSLFAQLAVTDNNTIKLGGQDAGIFVGKTLRYGENRGTDVDPDLVGGTGISIENGTQKAGESSGIYFDGDYIVMWSPGDGGNNPHGTFGYLLKVYDEDAWQLRWFLDGDGAAYQNSDSTRKEAIEPVTNSLSMIKQMRSVRYNFKKTDHEKAKMAASTGNNTNINNSKSIGFIAQQMEKIAPDLVRTDEKGNKFINYSGLIPYTVQAIQEQQTIIDQQDALIKSQANDLASIKAELDEIKRLLKK